MTTEQNRCPNCNCARFSEQAVAGQVSIKGKRRQMIIEVRCGNPNCQIIYTKRVDMPSDKRERNLIEWALDWFR